MDIKEEQFNFNEESIKKARYIFKRNTNNEISLSEPAQSLCTSRTMIDANTRLEQGKYVYDKTIKSSIINSNGREVEVKNNNEGKEKPLEIVSCILKVFDDIRQDNLALQVIKMFQYIFQSIGLDLFLYPYRTISNRTGAVIYKKYFF